MLLLREHNTSQVICAGSSVVHGAADVLELRDGEGPLEGVLLLLLLLVDEGVVPSGVMLSLFIFIGLLQREVGRDEGPIAVGCNGCCWLLWASWLFQWSFEVLPVPRSPSKSYDILTNSDVPVVLGPSSMRTRTTIPEFFEGHWFTGKR